MTDTSDEAAAPAVDDPNCHRTREDALARLRRAYGQLGGVITMMEHDRAAGDVLTQLSAVLHALHRASFRLVAAELDRCGGAADEGLARRAELEKLFVALG